MEIIIKVHVHQCLIRNFLPVLIFRKYTFSFRKLFLELSSLLLEITLSQNNIIHPQ